MKTIVTILAAAVLAYLFLIPVAFGQSPSSDGSLAANAWETPTEVRNWSPQLLRAICDKVASGGTVTAQAVATAKAVANAELDQSKMRVKALATERDRARAQARVGARARATTTASKPRVATQTPQPQYRRRKVGCNACKRLDVIEARLNAERDRVTVLATAIAEINAKLSGGQFAEELKRVNDLAQRLDDLGNAVKDLRRELAALTGRVTAVESKVDEIGRRKLGSFLTFGPMVGMALYHDGDVLYTTSLLGARLRFLITDRVSVAAEGGAAVSATGSGTFGNILVSYAVLKRLAVEVGPGGDWSDLSGNFLTRRMFLFGNVGATAKILATNRGSLMISLRGNIGVSRDSVATRLAGGFQSFAGWEF